MSGFGFTVDFGGQVVGGIGEPLGGDRADEEVEVIGDLLGEPLMTEFQGLEAGHEIPFV